MASSELFWCNPDALCSDCKLYTQRITARLNGENGKDPIVFDAANLLCKPGTYPVIFTMPECHTDEEIGELVASVDDELAPFAGPPLRVFRVASATMDLKCPIRTYRKVHYHPVVQFMIEFPEKVEVNRELRQKLFMGESFPAYTWEAWIPPPGECVNHMRLFYIDQNLDVIEKIEVPCSREMTEEF